MQGVTTVCILAAAGEPLAVELGRRLREAFHDFSQVDAAALGERELAVALSGAQALVAVRPSAAPTFLALGRGWAMGIPVWVLDGEEGDIPGARRVSSADALLRRISELSPPVRFLDAAQLRAQGACAEAVEWFERRYPQGGKTDAWTREEQVAALKDGGARWVTLGRKRRLIPLWPMEGVDLSGADLRGGDLRRFELHRAILDGAQLDGADLRRARLSEARLRGAHLPAAHARDADLRGADLSGADLRGAQLLRARLAGANLTGADLSGADLSEADLSGARLGRAVLHSTAFHAANLRQADLTDAQLHGARLHQADLTGAQLPPRPSPTGTDPRR